MPQPHGSPDRPPLLKLLRANVYILAWGLGTASAAAILWQGVRHVYAGADERQPILPGVLDVPMSGRTGGGNGADAGAGATPGPSDPADPVEKKVQDPPVPLCRATPGSADSPARAAKGRTRDYRLAGGVVTLQQTAATARLLGADPGPGWRRQFWCGIGWLRVDFAKADRVSTLIASWNGHPPQIIFDNHE